MHFLPNLDFAKFDKMTLDFGQFFSEVRSAENVYFAGINPLRGGGAEAPLPSSVVEGSASILNAGHILRRGAELLVF